MGRYALRYWAWYLGGLACLGLTNWLAVSIPLTLGRGTDALRAGDDEAVRAAALLIAGMGLAVIAVRTLSRALIFTPGRNIENDLRNDILAHVLRLRRDELRDHGAGDLVSRASNDISLVRALVGYGTLQVFNIAMAVVLAGRAMVDLSPTLTAACLAPVALATAASSGAIRTLFPLTRVMQQQLSSLSELVLSSLQGVATVQAFGAEHSFSERLDQQNVRYMGTVLRVATLATLVQPVLAFSAGVSLFLLLWLGAGQVLEGRVSVGDLVALSAFLLFLLPYLRSLGWLVAIVQRGRASLERIFEILDLPVPREASPSTGPTLAPGPLGFVLRDLGFAWPGAEDRPALEGVSTRIEPGSMVGVFGRTGAGKSTLLALLARQHDAAPGRILVQDRTGATVDLLELPFSELRRRSTVVPQVPFLFTTTIAENISMEQEASLRRAPQAAAEAALEPDLKRLPDGLRTVVGERGVTLSGGQRQRVALARGFARDFDLLLLDDVLSAVDHDTEQRLVKAILRRASGAEGQRPTLVVVSHRLGVLSHADRVLVLDQGRLVDQGHHSELILRPGPYRDAWRVQREEGEDEA
jgi:ATP-binding cassette subfamily B multidrug efflux pump